MTTDKIDVAALRRLLDEHSEWQASTDPTPKSNHRLLDAFAKDGPALLRAVEERDALLAACDAKDGLLACYRIGRRPSEALFKRLNAANEAILRAKNHP